MNYELIDSGNRRKLEKFGDYILVRPAPVAIWKPVFPEDEWKKADAVFSRKNGDDAGSAKRLPESWPTEIEGLTFKTSLTDFGHLGVFPEHRLLWKRLREIVSKSRRNDLAILNLFAYTGGATLSLASENTRICHLDASPPAVSWAKENAALNRMENYPIRWIVDDARKFVGREIKRGVRYDAVILDPPSFGRGNKGQVFKIEDDLYPLLQSCSRLLSDNPLFVCLSSHTAGFTGPVLGNILNQIFSASRGGKVESGDMLIYSKRSFPLSLGTYAVWDAAR